MRLSAPEKKILDSLNIEHKSKFKGNQLMEWSTSEIKPQDGEKVFLVKEYGVYVAIKL